MNHVKVYAFGFGYYCDIRDGNGILRAQGFAARGALTDNQAKRLAVQRALAQI